MVAAGGCAKQAGNRATNVQAMVPDNGSDSPDEVIELTKTPWPLFRGVLSQGRCVTRACFNWRRDRQERAGLLLQRLRFPLEPMGWS